MRCTATLARSRLPSSFPKVNLNRAEAIMTFAVAFELLAERSLVVVGGVTGARYHFSEHGRRVFVDPRDRFHVAMIEAVREIDK